MIGHLSIPKSNQTESKRKTHTHIDSSYFQIS